METFFQIDTSFQVGQIEEFINIANKLGHLRNFLFSWVFESISYLFTQHLDDA